MSTPVCIVATGARTPLGVGTAQSAAAVRAGISRLAHHSLISGKSGEPLPAAVDTALDPNIVGAARFVALADTALREACAPLADSPIGQGIPLFLGLPEIRPGFSDADARVIRSNLARLEGLPVQILEVNVFNDGHAAGLLALATATTQIREGAYDVCLVGGVESYLNPETMNWLDANRQLTGPISRSGFVPGEGAGFCLLMSNDFSARRRFHSMAGVHSVEVGRETKLIKTSDLCLGEALTTTVLSAVVGSGPTETIKTVICDINSERYRTEEWAFVCLRLPQCFEDPTAYLSPADCWGDLGAASGPLFAMLSCQAIARGYAAGKRTLIWASSEGGLRAAATLDFEKAKPASNRVIAHV